jgi:hypothetical protein
MSVQHAIACHGKVRRDDFDSRINKIPEQDHIPHLLSLPPSLPPSLPHLKSLRNPYLDTLPDEDDENEEEIYGGRWGSRAKVVAFLRKRKPEGGEDEGGREGGNGRKRTLCGQTQRLSRRAWREAREEMKREEGGREGGEEEEEEEKGTKRGRWDFRSLSVWSAFWERE